MKNIIKGIWSRTKKKPGPRNIETPKALQVKDLVSFKDSFSLPALLRGNSFEVQAVSTYQFEHSHYAEFTLKDSTGQLLFMSVDE